MDKFSQIRGLLHEAGDAVDTIPGLVKPGTLTASELMVLVTVTRDLRRKLAEAELALYEATPVSRPDVTPDTPTR